jgi:MFS family permease
MIDNIAEGFRIVARSRELRPVMILNLGQGVFLMASFMVGIPLMIRDIYGGGSVDLGIANVLNMSGITATTLIMLKMGGFVRQGRAVLTAFTFGGLILALIAAGLPYAGMIFVFFCWGMTGGVAIVLGRTIAQEWAPDSHRGQVLALYNMFFLGGAPIGASMIGYLADWLGVQSALMLVAAAMTTLTVGIGLLTRMWRLVPPGGELFPDEAETEVVESLVRLD